MHEVLVERSVLGWKEYELEVMRDLKDNVVIICSIENFDPMGVHTGDSITVAPAQTLSDVEYQIMRDAAIRIIREIMETGGSNIQFSSILIMEKCWQSEMNPGLRSSPLPQRQRISHCQDRRKTRRWVIPSTNSPMILPASTPACFEPTIDYCVVKVLDSILRNFRYRSDPHHPHEIGRRGHGYRAYL